MLSKLIYLSFIITAVLCFQDTIIKSDLVGEYIASGEKLISIPEFGAIPFPCP